MSCDSDENSELPTLLRMNHFRKRWKISVGLLLFPVGFVLFGWWKIANPSPWSDEREVEGAIYSVATGVTLKTGEIVVAGGYIRKDSDSFTRLIRCYLAKSGRILWELTDSEFPELEGLEFHLEIDASGDVIVVSDRQQNGERIESTVTKLSGSTGRILWEKTLNIQRTTHSRRFKLVELHRPVIDRSGNIWIVLMGPTDNGSYLELVLLDGRTGGMIAVRRLDGDLSDSLKSVRWFMWPIEIECLKSGGAMVFALDHQSRQHALRFTEKGDLHSQFSLAFPERGPSPIDHRRFVDEERGSITFSGYCWRGFCTAKGEHHVHAAGYSLEDGTKRWESAFPIKGHSSSLAGFLPKLTTLRKDGSLELREMVQIRKTKTDWLRWSVSQGIPSPERSSVVRSIPSRTIVSTKDGSIIDTSIEPSLSSWFKVHAGEANSTTREVFVFGGNLYNYSAGNIECVDPRIWLPMDPPESSRRRQRCFRIVRTISGRQILTRDPNDRFSGDPVFHWQVIGR